MTANQIAYFQATEARRANLAREKENTRHNLVSEGLTKETLGESKRHNLASEALSAGELAEKSRHNREAEAMSWYSAVSDARYKDNSIKLQDAKRKDEFQIAQDNLHLRNLELQSKHALGTQANLITREGNLLRDQQEREKLVLGYFQTGINALTNAGKMGLFTKDPFSGQMTFGDY